MARRSGTINLNSNLFGVSGGNTIGANEAVRVDFVTDVVSSGNNLGDWTYDGHYGVNGATASLVAAPGDGVVKISAFVDADGNNTVGDGAQEIVNGIVIKYNGSQSAVLTAADDDDLHDNIVEASDSDGNRGPSYESAATRTLSYSTSMVA